MTHDRIYQYGMLRVMMLVVVWCVAIMPGIAGNVYGLEDGDEVDAGGTDVGGSPAAYEDLRFNYWVDDTMSVNIAGQDIPLKMLYRIYYDKEGEDFVRFNVAVVAFDERQGGDSDKFIYKGKRYSLIQDSFCYKYERRKGPVYRLKDALVLTWLDNDIYPLVEKCTVIDVNLKIDIRKQKRGMPLDLKMGKGKMRDFCYKYRKIRAKHDEARKKQAEF